MAPALVVPEPEPPEPQAPPIPPEQPAGSEAERWRVDDLYDKPPAQWHRKPAVWVAAAALLAGVFFIVQRSGQDDAVTPLDLVTGETTGAGISLGNQARQRVDEAAEDPQPGPDLPPTSDASDTVASDPQTPGQTEASVSTPDPAAELPLESSVSGTSGATESEENLDALLAEMLVDQEPPVPPPVVESPAGSETADPRVDPRVDSGPTPRSDSSTTSTNPAVAQLLLDAELLLAANQLTLPEGENAWEAYQQILDIDPAQREALRGLARIQRTYVNRINAALAADDEDTARPLVERLRFIDPLHPDLPDFDAALKAGQNLSGDSNSPFRDPLRSGAQGPMMVPIASARAIVGDSDDPAASPVQQVQLSSFAIAAYETTVGEYRQFVRATGRPDPADAASGCNYWLFNWRQRADKSWRSPGYNQTDAHPVVCVNRDDAVAYTRWLSEETGQSYSLPSEAQWEYAASQDSSDGVYWTTSRDACDFANVSDIDRAERHNLELAGGNIFGCRDRRVATAPAGTYEATGPGLYDMLGNAGEWTSDCWRPNYEAPLDADPGCEAGVVRGGSWFERPVEVSVHRRLRLERNARFSHVGFRVVRQP